MNIIIKKHQIRQKHWAKEYHLRDKEKWAKMIDSDENKTELNSNARKYVQRSTDTRNNPKYTSKTVKFGGRHLMVCGDIKNNYTRKLIETDSTPNSKKYITLLKSHLFQHNGSPCYISHVTMFSINEDITKLQVWLSQRPENNNLTNVRKELKIQVYKQKIKELTRGSYLLSKGMVEHL